MKYRVDDTVKVIKVNKLLNSKRFNYPKVGMTLKIVDFDPNDAYLPYCCAYKEDDDIGIWVSEEEVELVMEGELHSITFLELATANSRFLMAIHREQTYYQNHLDVPPTHYTTMVKSNTKNKHGLNISNDDVFNVVNGILADRYCNNY